MTTQSKALRFADQLASSPYTSLGGYPLFAYTNDGAALCKHCAKTERAAIGTTTGSDGWAIIGLEINYENPALYCDHCSSRIESAYAEPPEPNMEDNH